ncbi:hypothetical protein [Pseudoalteromonas luteoviolacea]|uniref:hypothetical protein n=1 Tax=Pseudoalteromonas luteoviolacea TaxID=43657 RepID=UPI001B38D25A|nr:hypothetical protein [Pseudoalteromonas luteoviolacea]MBQ4840039.1 hypothetical protein [Pseudoalteromonas luteoviolacea]
MLNSLHKLLDYFQKERLEQDNKTVEAITAISKALNETKKYLENSKGQKCYNRKKEFELSDLWSEASAAVYCVHKADKQFSIELYAKSLYWSGIDKWSEEETTNKKIRLEDIESQIESLLSKRS